MNNIFKKLILLLIQTKKTCRGASFKDKLSILLSNSKIKYSQGLFWKEIKIKVKIKAVSK